MKMPKVLVLGTLVVVMCLAGESLADRSPSTCSANNLFLNLTKSTTTVKNGQDISYTVEVGNQNGTGCLVDNVTVTIQLPAADGTATGTIVTIDTGASFPVDGTGNTTYPPVVYTVAVNPGVVDVVAKATASGTLHDAPTNHTAEIIKTVGTTVIWPNTLVGITATPNSGMFPITTNLVVTEQNTGDDPLTAVQVAVTKEDSGGSSTVATLVFPPDSFGGGDSDNILEPGETWTWNTGALFGIVLTKDTTFTAIGTGLDSENEAVTFPTYPSEKAQASVDGDYPPPCLEVTKTVNCDEATEGATVTYHYCITNCGDLPLTLTSIDDTVVPDEDVDDAFHAVHGLDSILAAREQECFNVDYTIPQGAADPLVNTFTVVGKDQFDQEISDYASATVDILKPCLLLEKSCTSTDPVEKGGVAFFRISLTNCGDLPLVIDVTDIDDPDCDSFDGTLDAGEGPVTCDLSIDIPADFTGTEFINHVRADWATIPSLPCVILIEDTENAQAPCEVTGGATRTPGFWKTHTAFAEHVLETHCGGVLDLGFVQLDTIDEVCAYFWANKANNSDGSKRTKLCQARMHAAFQAIAALLNNCVPSGGGIPVSPAEIATILGGTDIDAIQELAGILGAYNESGDDIALIDPDASPGSATPQECRAYDQSIADCESQPKPGKGPK